MPPQAVQTLPPLPPDSRVRTPLLLGLLVIALALAGAAYYFFASPGSQSRRDPNRLLGFLPTDLIQSKKNGDYEAAAQELAELRSKPNQNVNEEALATYNSIMVEFNLTADTNALLKDVQNLKTVLLDTKVDPWIRIRALNALSSAYCRSGRDPLVFQEIYKDAPFSSYLAPDDPDLSARHLAEWSYGTSPTSFAAARLARWYSEQIMYDESLPEATRTQYVEETKKHIANADSLVARETERDSTYTSSMQYATYRFWRTIAIGRLAAVVGEPYKSSYKKEFEDLLTFVYSQKNADSLEYAYLTRHFYAQLLVKIDGDKTGAKTVLDTLAEELAALKKPDVITYVRFVRNENGHRPEGYLWKNTEAMMALSPSYKAIISTFLRGPSTTNASSQSNG